MTNLSGMTVAEAERLVKEVNSLRAEVERLTKEVVRLQQWPDAGIDLIKKAEQFEAENERLRAAAQDFIDKVDSGRARSVDSYRKFKEALENGHLPVG